MKSKASFWCALTLFSLTGQIAWVIENMYFNVFIYKMFHASAADISLMVAASAVTATVTAVCMGALSDKIGKRKMLICAGYILWGISVFSFVFLRRDIISPHAALTAGAASLGVSLTIILDCVMTFFGSTANDAAFNAWLTDSTTKQNRGLAEGINAMMPLVSILVVFGGSMFLDQDLPRSWVIIFSAVGSLMILVGIAGLFLIQEPPIKPSKTGYLQNIFYGFRPSTVQKNPMLYLALAAFVLFNISIQIFMPYLILYYEVSLGMKDYVLIMAPAIIIASVVTVLWGKLYDKKGFALSGVGAVLLLCAGYLLLYITRSTVSVFIGSLLMMSGYLAGMAVFGALIRDNTPIGKAGRLQGIRIFSQVLMPGVIGPWIGKTVLQNAETVLNSDGTHSFIPNANIFLAALPFAACVLLFLAILAKQRERKVQPLYTPFESQMPAVPYTEYPRPQMQRDSYLCLNGPWQFTVHSKSGKVRYQGNITVPFAPQSRLSGVDISIGRNDVLEYSRTFTLPQGFIKRHTLLHIGACDQYTEVRINGQTVAEGQGGYLPVHADISDHLRPDENTLHIIARDPMCTDLPYGKQSRRPHGMWYTNISGIWQTVWLESVCEGYIQSLKITPDLQGITLQVVGGEDQKILLFGGKEYAFTGDTFRLDVDDPILWTPEHPHLYPFEVISGEDRVCSYFGLRTVGIEQRAGKQVLCLNGKPHFFNGLLDQGYYSDGIFLPATPQGFCFDIQTAKRCGFDMLRKHIKLEPELFYYYCDKMGMLVFQDMINSGRYSFFWDTALPTLFLKKGFTHRASKKRRALFKQSCQGILQQLYNHPCVVYYTIFNEGWGQFDANRQYQKYKQMDPTRIYDTTSGWFRTRQSDVRSEHVYFKPIALPKDERPLVLSEFGGYSYPVSGHRFNLKDNYGYRLFSTDEQLQKAVTDLYTKQVLPAVRQGLCAAVLTQMSDVEDETNGIVTYDRQVLKLDATQTAQTMKQIRQAFEKKFQ